MSEATNLQTLPRNDSDTEVNKEEHDIRTIEKLIQNLLNLLIKGLQKLEVEEKIFDNFQNVFYSSDSLEEYLDGLCEMLKVLVSKIDGKIINKSSVNISIDKTSQILRESLNAKNPLSNENYENLEKVLQKYEAEIREHIRIEQQLKIYSDGLEEKLSEKDAECQEKLDKMQKQIDDLNSEKSHLSKLLYDLKFEKLFLEKKLKKNGERNQFNSREPKQGSIRKVN